MSKTKIMKMPMEFDELLKRQVQQLIEDCQALGIKKSDIPKTKATKFLVKRIIENEQNQKISFRLVQ